MSLQKNKTQLGLKENWLQFSILVLVNAFVGAMVGLERTIFPQFAEIEFGVASKTAILSFITAFGISKAIANYFTGKLSNYLGRKNLLVLGWCLAIAVPIILMMAPTWGWVIFANVVLGVSQGFTWSSTVIMKIDLVGPKNRGLAMGLNEFAGYFSVGILAYLSSIIATNFGVTPYPFYLGLGIAIAGTLLSVLFVADTKKHVALEQKDTNPALPQNIFLQTTLKHKNLSAITQAGLVNNLNDGMIWGLLPIYLFNIGYSTVNIGILAAIYPTIWGIGQLFTGKMADIFSKKKMLFWGMFAQAIAIMLLPQSVAYLVLVLICIILGLGTALVYPTFLAAIADEVSPNQRAETIGIFRLWRDLGYAIGAITSGVIADIFGVTPAIICIGAVTLFSSFIIQFRMKT